MTCAPVDPRLLRERSASFVDLLVGCVDAGAGVGFLAPLPRAKAEAYWAQVAREIGEGRRLLFAAFEGDALVGSVQLEPARRETAPHRAEVQKLLVDPRARRRGVARALMARAEAAALARGRTLLLLDTFEGTVADAMYRRWGWAVAGRIPDYAMDPAGDLKPLVLFYKDLRPSSRAS
ncbi:MAG TPA: GNAT family N-acetyltransferase [Candidatus Thermoplasmatota archaeon]|nr:GNAT family N-acetyltransferase [Candidatus Thermoplasmatota archaeon]